MQNLNPQSKKTVRGYEVVSWPDVAKQVRAVNPGLADVIDDITPPNSWKIVKVRYAFGDELLRKGELFVPHEDKLIGINDGAFNPELNQMLNYNSVPVGLTLNAKMELFISHQETVLPFSLMLPGNIFALWTALDDLSSPFRGKIWNIAAGCRSLFFLPKITDAIALKRINKEFCTTFQIPHSLWEQWHLLKGVAAFQPDPWFVDVVFFSQDWFKEGAKQRQLRFFLLNTAWRSTTILRNDVIFSFIYSHAQEEKNIKIDPYLSDTIKYLFSLGCSFYPGFVFADSNISAPIDFLQAVFNDVYALEYTPTLMHLDYLTADLKKSVFYSLQLPTLVAFSPKAREKSTKIDALYYIQASMKRLKNYILTVRQDMKGQPLYDWAERVDYSYYHSYSTTTENSIRPVSNLLDEEPVLQSEQNSFKKPFCETNGFMRGLIKLSLV